MPKWLKNVRRGFHWQEREAERRVKQAEAELILGTPFYGEHVRYMHARLADLKKYRDDTKRRRVKLDEDGLVEQDGKPDFRLNKSLLALNAKLKKEEEAASAASASCPSAASAASASAASASASAAPASAAAASSTVGKRGPEQLKLDDSKEGPSAAPAASVSAAPRSAASAASVSAAAASSPSKHFIPVDLESDSSDGHRCKRGRKRKLLSLDGSPLWGAFALDPLLAKGLPRVRERRSRRGCSSRS